jgi:hypothetical protein
MKRGNWKWVFLTIIVVVVLGYVFLDRGDSGTTVTRQANEQAAAEYAAGDVEPGSVQHTSGISSPIELDLTLISANEFGGEDSGGEVVVGVMIKPLIDSQDMHWFVKLPEGLSMISGPGTWEGQVEKGMEKTFELTFSVPDGKSYEIYSRAEAYMANGDVVTKGTGLRIDLGPEERGDNPPFERTDSEGRRIISYKGKTEGGGQ